MTSPAQEDEARLAYHKQSLLIFFGYATLDTPFFDQVVTGYNPHYIYRPEDWGVGYSYTTRSHTPPTLVEIQLEQEQLHYSFLLFVVALAWDYSLVIGGDPTSNPGTLLGNSLQFRIFLS